MVGTMDQAGLVGWTVKRKLRSRSLSGYCACCCDMDLSLEEVRALSCASSLLVEFCLRLVAVRRLVCRRLFSAPVGVVFPIAVCACIVFVFAFSVVSSGLLSLRLRGGCRLTVFSSCCCCSEVDGCSEVWAACRCLFLWMKPWAPQRGLFLCCLASFFASALVFCCWVSWRGLVSTFCFDVVGCVGVEQFGFAAYQL